MRIIIQLCIMLSCLLITLNFLDNFKISKFYKIIIFLNIITISFIYLDKSEINANNFKFLKLSF